MKLVFFFKIILSLLIVNFASSQDHQEEKFKEIALEIINSAKYSVLTTVNNSSADSRTMDHFKVNPDFILYFGTNILGYPIIKSRISSLFGVSIVLLFLTRRKLNPVII